MRTVVARVPLVTVVVTKPFVSVVALTGSSTSEPLPVSWNWMVTPAIGRARVSFAWKVTTACSGRPEARTPIVAGRALTNAMDPTGIVGVIVAAGVTVGVFIGV